MQTALKNTARNIYTILLIIWTAIFVGFWAVIFLGAEVLQWLLVTVLGAGEQGTDAMINLMQHVSGWGLLFIWAMGALTLYIIKRLVFAQVDGPGGPYNVDLVNEGKIVDSSATDKTDIRR